MTAKTHNAFAIAGLALASVVFPQSGLGVSTVVFSLIGASIGALIPDMDQAGNNLWDIFPAGNYLGKILRRVFYKHRTLSHSLLGGFLIFKGIHFLLYSTYFIT